MWDRVTAIARIPRISGRKFEPAAFAGGSRFLAATSAPPRAIGAGCRFGVTPARSARVPQAFDPEGVVAQRNPFHFSLSEQVNQLSSASTRSGLSIPEAMIAATS